MALDTYSGLKTAIADYLDRDDLTSQIDDFIDLAEARHKDDIRIRDMQRRAQVSASTRYIPLPSGFLEMQSLRLLTNPISLVTEVNFHEMNRVRLETTGKPQFFTVHEEIEFDRAPDSAYTAEMIYYASFTALSDSNTTNALLTRSPGAYLYGALVEAAPYLVDDERVPLWERMYQRAADGLSTADKRSRHGGQLLASRVAGATP